MKRYVFPYEIGKYAKGLILTVLLGVFLFLIISLIDGSPIFLLRVRDIVKSYVVIIIPLLIIGSLIRYYWLPMVIYILITAAYTSFVMLNWVPYPVNTSVWSKMWDVVFVIVKIIIQCVTVGVFFQQYCKRQCRLTENRQEG